MDGYRPKRLIVRILEFAALFALSAFLIRLGVCCLAEIWPALAALAAVIAILVIFVRMWKNRLKW